MREIKFRAWEEKGKDMIYSHRGNFVMEFDGVCSFIDWGNDYFKPMPELILMQFTGLKDKNGKEIYEGDIVKRDGGIEPTFLVEWNKEIACFQFKLLYGNKNTMYDVRLYRSDEEFEVIGNKFENPELLEEVQK